MHSPTRSNSVCSFVIPGQGSPGVFWDLSQTSLGISRDTRNEASGASGGTQLRDYTRCTKSFARATSTIPTRRCSSTSFSAGGFQARFINCTDSESGVFDMRAPGGEEITTVEVLGQMEAVTENVAVAICSILSTRVTLDPRNGTVSKGW